MSEECNNCKSITLFKGSDGRTIYNGTGAPTLTTANAGDFYIDTSTWEIYGPYTGSSWGTGTSLIGSPGSPGAQGVYGGWSSGWLFDSLTGSGTSAGDFRLNNAAPALVTVIHVNKDNEDSTDMAAFVSAWNNGAKGLIRISKKDNPNVFWMGVVTGVFTGAGSDLDVSVTYTTHNGTFGDNESYVLSFVYKGDIGTSGADANSNYANTAWVDPVNGNDSTGVVGRFDLPYLTYAGAAIDVLPGDLIWMRKGTYATNITLVDGVDVHFDTGSILQGQITDNATKAVCKVFGDFDIVFDGNNAIDLQGIGSDISVFCNTIDCIGTCIYASNGLSKTGILTVNCNRIINTNVNYVVAIRGGARVVVNVKQYVQPAGASSDFNVINLRDWSNGSLNFNCPAVTIGDSTTSIIGGIFLYEETSVSSNCVVNINVDNIISSYDYASANSLGTITKEGAGKLYLNIKKLNSRIRSCILQTSDHPTSAIYINGGHYRATDNVAVRHVSSGKFAAKNATFYRDNNVIANDDNEVIVQGNGGGYPAIGSGVTTESLMEFIGCQFVKDSGGNDVTGALVARDDGNNVRMFFKDCYFHGKGTWTGQTVSAITAVSPNNDFYFNNCMSSNATLAAAAITQQEVGGAGITVNDIYLDIFDY